jgi:hypothetical protein
MLSPEMQKARRRIPRQRADESSYELQASHTAAGTVSCDDDGDGVPAIA